MPANEPVWSYAVQCCTAVFPVENKLIPGQISSTEPKYPCFSILSLGLLKEHYQKTNQPTKPQQRTNQPHNNTTIRPSCSSSCSKQHSGAAQKLRHGAEMSEPRQFPPPPQAKQKHVSRGTAGLICPSTALWQRGHSFRLWLHLCTLLGMCWFGRLKMLTWVFLFCKLR